MNKLYKVGEIAKICDCCPRSVAKWIDKKVLKGHRLPHSKHRRVRHIDLIKFLREHGYSTEGLETDVGIKIPEINEDLIAILGRSYTECKRAANTLRKDGMPIPESESGEQAYVIHWLLYMYQLYGEEWATRARDALIEMNKV